MGVEWNDFYMRVAGQVIPYYLLDIPIIFQTLYAGVQPGYLIAFALKVCITKTKISPVLDLDHSLFRVFPAFVKDKETRVTV